MMTCVKRVIMKLLKIYEGDHMIFCPVCKSTDVSKYQYALDGNKCHVCLNCGILFLDRTEREIYKKERGC